MFTTLHKKVFAASAVLFLLIAASAQADWTPIPTFEHHELPTSSVPDVTGSVLPVIDIAAMVIALSLASYFTLFSRSRRYLLGLTIVCLGYFGFYRDGCVCPIGATQNVALGIVDTTYVVPATVVAFFVLPLVFTLFFGRTFCGSVCPLGAMQELVAVKTVAVPRWLDHSLGLLAYVYLGASVVFAATKSAFLICRYDPFVSFFRLDGNMDLLVLGTAFMVMSVFVGRPYCRYLCPYGAILRVLGCFSKWRLTITPTDCITCQMCEDVCPYGAIQPPTKPQTAPERLQGRRQLTYSIFAFPFVIGAFFLLGYSISTPLSTFNATVRLAEAMRYEETFVLDPEAGEDAVLPSSDATDFFRASGRPVEELYAEAVDIKSSFVWYGGVLGIWTGLVVAIKLVVLSIRKQRNDYVAEQSGCVSCGRCYFYCPVEKERLGLISPAELVQLETDALKDKKGKKAKGTPQETSA